MSDPSIRLTRAQVREVDRLAIKKYHIPGIVLMENAAIGAADVAWDMIARTPRDITIICGGGNNGGDGFAIARHLHNRGCHINLYLTSDPSHLKGDALINYRIVDAMELFPQQDIPQLDARTNLIIDAIFGTGLTRPPSSKAAEAIDNINQSFAQVLAIDLPSGLDCDTGEPLGAAVRATRTVTFVAEKTGFTNPASRKHTGEVVVANIGCPKELVEEVRTLR